MKKEFDYFIFIDYSENLIGYMIIDNKQYSNFERLVRIINGRNIKVIKESKLKKGSIEYRMSLVVDTLLNIERLKYENK